MNDNRKEIVNELKKALEIDKAMNTYEIEITETKTITVPVAALSLEHAIEIAKDGFQWELLDEEMGEISVEPKGNKNG